MAKKKKAKKVSKKKVAKKGTSKKVTKKAPGKKAAKKKKVTKKAPAKKVAKKKVTKKAAKKKVTKKKVAKKVTKKKATKKAATKKVTKKKTTKKAADTKVAKKKAVKKVEAPAKAPKKSEKSAPKSGEAKAVKAKPKADAKKKVAKPTVIVEPKPQVRENAVLTDAEGRVLCRVRDCDQPSVVESYCRYHYLLFWRKIQSRKRILKEGKLEKYIEELTSRYPQKYLEMLKKDLFSENDFLSAIQELEIDESLNDDRDDFEDDRNFIEEVRGVSASSEREESEY